MQRFLLAAALIGSCAALPVQALEFGNGFSFSADIEAETAIDNAGSQSFGIGNFTLSYQPEGSALGGFVGYDTFVFDSVSLDRIYGAVTYKGGFGTVQVGAPRAALDDYFDAPPIAGVRAYQYLLPIAKSAVGVPIFGGDGDVPFGLRYDGSFGALTAGASVHRLGDSTITDLAGRYALGKTQLSAGVERVEGAGFSSDSYHLGAVRQMGKLRLGAVMTSYNSFDQTLSEVFASYAPLDRLSVTATGMVFDIGFFTQNFVGLSGRFDVTPKVYIEGGLLQGDVGDAIYNLSVGAKF